MTDEARLSWAVAASLLLHLTLLALLPVLRQLHLPVGQPAAVEVDLTQLPSRPPPLPAAPKPAPAAEPAPAPAAPVPALLPKQQIVSPPDAGEERAPETTRLLSDRDNTVREEIVRRGESGHPEAAVKPPAPHPAEAPKAAAPPRQQVAALPSLERLLPKAGDFVRHDVPAAATPPAPPTQNRNLLAGNGGAFSARPGTNDFLPSIREGDITLLNTKAELFAPFVRRVAARVFQHLDIGLKQALRRGATGSGREFAEVEAVMSKTGELVNVRVLERESHSTLGAYRELLDATKPDIFFDANPPPGAEANDGNIHFILLVDLMVQSAMDPRTGTPVGGYYGVAGVGLDSPAQAQ